MSERDESVDLRWRPTVQDIGFYRVEHSLTVSPSPGAHMHIELPLPDGVTRIRIILEKEGAVT